MTEFEDNSMRDQTKTPASAPRNEQAGADDGSVLVGESGELGFFTADEQLIIKEVYRREGSRLRTYYLLALGMCVLLGLGLFSSMQVDSIFVVAGCAVAGLVVWAALIGGIPLKPGNWLYSQVVAGDRSNDEQQLLKRLEE